MQFQILQDQLEQTIQLYFLEIVKVDIIILLQVKEHGLDHQHLIDINGITEKLAVLILLILKSMVQQAVHLMQALIN